MRLIGNSARYDGCSRAREGMGNVKSVPSVLVHTGMDANLLYSRAMPYDGLNLLFSAVRNIIRCALSDSLGLHSLVLFTFITRPHLIMLHTVERGIL